MLRAPGMKCILNAAILTPPRHLGYYERHPCHSSRLDYSFYNFSNYG